MEGRENKERGKKKQNCVERTIVLNAIFGRLVVLSSLFDRNAECADEDSRHECRIEQSEKLPL